MLIVDSQVHIWLANRPDRPWHEGADAQLEKPFGYEDLLAQMKAAGVDRAIIVPPSWEGDRVDYGLEAAQKYPDRFGVMGRLPAHNAEGCRLIENWMQQKGMLGARLTFNRPYERAWLADGSLDWFWPAAERLGIPLMLHPWRKEFADIAAKHPRLKIIMDHMGFERDVRDEMAGPAMDRLFTFAQYPNVAIKVSGVPGYSTDPYPYSNLHGHLQQLIEKFGAHRCFWGTDLTRLTQKCTYRQAVTLFTEELKFLSAEDKEWIMGRGITEFLGWKV